MAKHRRYPKKKSQKFSIRSTTSLSNALIQDGNEKLALSSSFSTGAANKNGRRVNRAPAKSAIDDQPIPWRLRELKQLAEDSKKREQQKTKRRKTPNNRLLEETLKLGYQQRPWEGTHSLVNRFNRDQDKAINDELLKARFGAAGRDVKEIAKEYETLDEKARRRKLQEMAQREKKKKLREKERAFIKNQQNRKSTIPLGVGIGEEDGLEPEQKKAGNEEEAQKTEAISRRIDAEKAKRKRPGKNDKLRLKRQVEREQAEKELILNAHEIIPFGERVDAPPNFSGELGRSIRPLFAEAGKKELLLKKLLSTPKN